MYPAGRQGTTKHSMLHTELGQKKRNSNVAERKREETSMRPGMGRLAIKAPHELGQQAGVVLRAYPN